MLPLKYFIEKPFQNWTREGASIIGTVMLYVDHTAPVALMRAKLEELVRASPLWDGQVVNLQVSDAKEHVIEVRLLVSSSSSPRAWDLRCEMREKMIVWLAAEHPYALPRLRTDMGRQPAPDPRQHQEREERRAQPALRAAGA